MLQGQHIIGGEIAGGEVMAPLMWAELEKYPPHLSAVAAVCPPEFIDGGILTDSREELHGGIVGAADWDGG